MTPGTTWLASYPKSGNTWLRVFLDNWFAASDTPADINSLSAQTWSPNDPTRFESATLVPPEALLPSEIEALRAPAAELLASELESPAIVKLHNAYAPAFGAPVAQAAIYIVRDPRDVVPSLASHLNISIDQAIDTLNAPATVISRSERRLQRQLPQTLSDWSSHVRGWLDEANLPVHLVRYEDLPGAFAGVLEFMGEPRDPIRFDRAVRHSRLEELQRQERANGFKERQSEAPFFRQGQSGAWRQTLTPAQAARIESAHFPQMHRLAYP